MTVPASAVDRSITSPPWRTLAPRGGAARGVFEVVRWRIGTGEPGPRGQALADALVAIATAMRRAFPHNIFGDLERIADVLWRASADAEEPAAHLREQGLRIAALHDRFGGGTSINFRYTHDFLYGFDWAKWVARDPSARATVGPYDLPFLAYTERRADELIELIDRGGDAKYPQLPDGLARNPFGFSREPSAEAELHVHLARRGLLPVQAWCSGTEPVWDRPFADLRAEAAVRLGLADSGAR